MGGGHNQTSTGMEALLFVDSGGSIKLSAVGFLNQFHLSISLGCDDQKLQRLYQTRTEAIDKVVIDVSSLHHPGVFGCH
jgi:hypothetical protein